LMRVRVSFFFISSLQYLRVERMRDAIVAAANL
jgi:hypothetical protein